MLCIKGICEQTLATPQHFRILQIIHFLSTPPNGLKLKNLISAYKTGTKRENKNIKDHSKD